MDLYSLTAHLLLGALLQTVLTVAAVVGVFLLQDSPCVRRMVRRLVDYLFSGDR